MITRFDEEKYWITNDNMYKIEEMETAHLINILQMFIKQPEKVMKMIINDIECRNDSIYEEWTVKSVKNNIKKNSINNVTSLSARELVSYSLESALGKAIQAELADRGVNVENIINLVEEEM